MAINSILSAWQANLEGAEKDQDTRFYIDPRQREYPDIGSGSPTFSLSREQNLIDRGNCESTTAPMMFGETVPVTAAATWTRSADYYHGGKYSYKLIKTNAAGTQAYIMFVDSTDTNDMHGFITEQTYEIGVTSYIPSASGIAASEVTLEIGQYYAGDWHGTILGRSSTLDAWETIGSSIAINAAATGIYLFIRVALTAALNEYFYVDDIIVKTHINIGDFSMTGGYSEHLVPLASKGTIVLEFIPKFTFDIATLQGLFGWWVTGKYLVGYYNPYVDMFEIAYSSGGSDRVMRSAQYDNGASYRNINQRIRLIFAYDLTTGTTAGSSLWLNKTQDDVAWNNNIDAFTMSRMLLRWGSYNIYTGNCDYIKAEYIPNRIVTDAEVQADLDTVYDERIIWDFNGHATGRTACLLPAGRVLSFATSRGLQNPVNGDFGADTAVMELLNNDAAFSDEQYAAFDPTANYYNGTVSQKYLQRRVPVRVEHWYNGDHDVLFTGRVDNGLFKRRSTTLGISRVTVNLEDGIADLAKSTARTGAYWTNKLISSTTEANSLIHLVGRMGSKRYWKQYLGNSGFENATIGNSWSATASLTLTRQADPFSGTYCGQGVAAAASQYVSQIVTFTGKDVLIVGNSINFSVLLKSAGAATSTIDINEQDSGGTNDSTTAAYDLAGGEGYVRYEVTHTITDSTSDRIQVVINVANGVTLKFDDAQLIRNGEAIPFIIDNTTDGASGVISADSYAEGSYDLIGYDVESTVIGGTGITHPWRPIFEGTNIWESLKQLAVAAGAERFEMSPSGTLQLRIAMVDTYTDKIALETFTEDDAIGGISSSISPASANRIIGHADQIRIDTGTRLLWSAASSGWFDTLDENNLDVTVANGDDWPDPATYGQLWASLSVQQIKAATPETEQPQAKETFLDKLNRIGEGFAQVVQAIFGVTTGGLTSILPEIGSGAGKTSPDSQPAKSSAKRGSYPTQIQKTIIGVQNPSLKYFPDANFSTTTFDTSSRPGSANILINNDSGDSSRLFTMTVLGQPVYRLSGQWVSDNLRDEQDIARNGERVYEFGNGDIVGLQQLSNICWYQWRERRTPKHVRQFALKGARHWMTPGDWYVLTIGASGQTEDVSEIAQLVQIDIDYSSGIPMSNCVFREVEERLEFNNNIYARMIAEGTLVGQRRGIVIGASDSAGAADIYCDGTDDDVVINAAIDAITGSGGGRIELLSGNFATTAQILLKDGIEFVGQGPGATTIEMTGNQANPVLRALGSAGTHLGNIKVARLTIVNSSTNSSSQSVNISYVDNVICEDLIIDDGDVGLQLFTCINPVLSNIRCINQSGDGIVINTCTNVMAQRLISDGITGSGRGVYVASSGGHVSDVSIANMASSFGVIYGMQINGDGVSISGVRVSSCDCSDPTVYPIGIFLTGTATGITLINAIITGVTNSGDSSRAYGIYIDSDRCSLSALTVDSCDGVGVQITSNADRTTIASGSSLNNTTSQFVDSGTNSAISSSFVYA